MFENAHQILLDHPLDDTPPPSIIMAMINDLLHHLPATSPSQVPSSVAVGIALGMDYRQMVWKVSVMYYTNTANKCWICSKISKIWA